MEEPNRSQELPVGSSLQPWSRRRLIAMALVTAIVCSAFIALIVLTWPLFDLDYRHLWTAQFSLTNILCASLLGGMVVKQQGHIERSDWIVMFGVIFGLISIVLAALVSFILVLQYFAKRPEGSGKVVVLLAGLFAAIILGFGFCVVIRRSLKSVGDWFTVASYIFGVVSAMTGILVYCM